MQFVCRGPDVPERLLQAHEDGRVVFFCGAGISYPARLPGFSGLVTKLYEELSVAPNPVQLSAINAGQFDTAVGLLESAVVGGRGAVRRALADILKPDLAAPNATATHEALLTLAQNREGCTRLITTNFDRLFEEVRAAKQASFSDFQAPHLPMPKSRWDGLVYLHGLLPSHPTAGDLDRLVISSGDFGLAYLNDRWASRFVSELFRNYTVCFVGYSINDPVLRYMLDALAADRLMGEAPPEMFAFGSYSKGKEPARSNEWKAKNVTPVLYPEHRRHAHLHDTLRKWAETYRDGVRGKERIVSDYAMARPLASTEQDDFVGRMLWALSDPSGLPAKKFAELDPVPSLDWLEPLSQNFFRSNDLGRFNITPLAARDDKLTYSLTRRPAPYTHAPWMTIVDAGQCKSNWDDVMFQLARWLIRHLDDPKLLMWVIKQGGQLHDRMVLLIENYFRLLGRPLVAPEPNRNRENEPRAIPRPAMRTLWRLLLNGDVKSQWSDFGFGRWRNQFEQDGLTVSVRWALRKGLAPYVCLYGQVLRSDEFLNNKDDESQDQVGDLVYFQVVLKWEHVLMGLRDLFKDPKWKAALPELLDDSSSLLHDTLDLMRELGIVSRHNDQSVCDQPSISDHPQNKGYRDWTALIELARDAWLATTATSPERARLVAEKWALGPYPVFRRLAFFAAAQGRLIPLRQALDWLLAEDHLWLWSLETSRETMRLLVSLAPELNATMLTELEQAILSGPPRGMYRDDIEPDAWGWLVDREVWLRLAKLAQAGATLNEAARSRFDALSAQYHWELADDESDEFPVWKGEVHWVDGHYRQNVTARIPRTRRGVLDYLLAHPVLEDTQTDDWRELCSEMFQATSYALIKLSQQEIWPIARWREALQAWSEESLRDRSWRFLASVVVKAPNDLVQTLRYEICHWLRAVAHTFEGNEDHFLRLAQRILDLDYDDDGNAEDPVFCAINHPIGRTTEGLLVWWYRQNLDDGQGIPESIKPIFTRLCDVNVGKFRHGRTMLAAHAIKLYRVDKAWSEQYLLPLLEWGRSEFETKAVWDGFLWSARLYGPLLKAVAPAFLDTANHYTKLGQHNVQYVKLLTLVALNPGETLAMAQLVTAIRALPADGLNESIAVLVSALEDTAGQRVDCWENRILPLWREIRPNAIDQAQETDPESLALLCIAAGDAFPSAMKEVGGWLRVVQDPYHVIHRLQKSGLSARFPEEVLRLLSTVLGDQSWPTSELRQCLDAISLAMPELLKNNRFMAIDSLARRSNF